VTRRHGWGGAPPASDSEAVARIVGAAVALMDTTRAEISIADIARSLGVIRQTVYRYFPSADALMEAAAVTSVGSFLDRMEEHVRGITDPGDAVVEGVAYVMETLPATPHMSLLLSPLRPNRFSVAITSEQARTFGRSMLDRFDVDWPANSFDDAALDELTEFILRTIQSFIIDPGEPQRSGVELRGYLHRWVGAAVAAHRAGLSGSRPRMS
jgi:AcrR family transcriptional regulator